MSRALFVVRFALRQRTFVSPSLNLVRSQPISQSGPAKAKSQLKVEVLTRNQDGVKKNFRELKGGLFSIYGYTSIHSLTLVIGLQHTIDKIHYSLSDKFTRVEKTVTMIRWQLYAVFVIAFVFAGGILWMAKLGWDLVAGDFGKALSAVVRFMKSLPDNMMLALLV
ncbi:hypothetical protein B9Z19DRAFT_1110921 [Tuber borchii]|uniref:Uncharacterized protein n=1 Tax=Tuber borchii TaxID=42251 RepID=A0A2T6ZF08_TUBBO|nr:hypothetical protein B9Z19DRAFT_1110921 [Tuber borchii]